MQQFVELFPTFLVTYKPNNLSILYDYMTLICMAVCLFGDGNACISVASLMKQINKWVYKLSF